MTLGVYIQVPFCQTKCTYCNFHTGVVSRDRYEPYADAICKEIAACATSGAAMESESHGISVDTSYFGRGTPSLLEPAALGKTAVDTVSFGVGSPSLLRPGALGETAVDTVSFGGGTPSLLKPAALGETTVDTVYFGGGTPSLLEPGALAKILGALGRHFALATSGLGAAEVTLEADPETITREKAEAWIAAGFNRISLGAQSFCDAELQAAGRMHRRADIFSAARLLREAGFRNISMDLIAGLAHQTRESWEESVTQLSRLRPEHLSIYMLEIDEGSRLGKESLAGGTRYSASEIPCDDDIADFYESACARLALEGYEHYEISNWAQPGMRSRHNLKYWRRQPYLGFGAGAHSFDGVKRWSNVHDSAGYVACIEQGTSPREQIETVTSPQALEEELFLGLRQLEGVDLGRIEREYGVSLRERIAPLRDQGLLEMNGAWLRLAPDRLTVSNEVFVELLGSR